MLVVAPATVPAVAATTRVATVLGRVAADLQVVVRTGRGGGLPPRAVAEALGLPLAATIRDEPGVASAAEQGGPPTQRGRGALAATASALLDRFGRGRLEGPA